MEVASICPPLLQVLNRTAYIACLCLLQLFVYLCCFYDPLIPSMYVCTSSLCVCLLVVFQFCCLRVIYPSFLCLQLLLVRLLFVFVLCSYEVDSDYFFFTSAVCVYASTVCVYICCLLLFLGV